MKTVTWLTAPEDHDYHNAAQYLSLLEDPANGTIQDAVDRLRNADESHYLAKDILRASQLTLLPNNNAHVRKDLEKITAGQSLSPILLIRGNPLIIADGYHRVCAAYHISENEPIPCRIT